MSYHVQRLATVLPLRPTRSVRGLGLDLGIPGVNVGTEGVTINTTDIANKIVGIMWPPVEQKVNALVPVIVDTAVTRVKARLPELIDVAWPILEKKANALIGTYETRYMGMASAQLGPYQALTKYATPVLLGLAALGVLVGAAAIKTLKK